METALPLQQYSVKVEGKTFGIRAVAYIIDSIVSVIANLVIQFMAGLIMGIVLYAFGQEFPANAQVSQGLSFIMGSVSFFLYFMLFEWLHGATPGKLVLSMRVIGEDGTPCTLRGSLIRGLFRFIDGLFFGIPAYASMKAPLYQRIGDKSAKTLVVSSNDVPDHQRRPWWWFLIASGLYLAVEAVFSLFLVISMLR